MFSPSTKTTAGSFKTGYRAGRLVASTDASVVGTARNIIVVILVAVVLTCYDAVFARLLDGAEVDVLLVGERRGVHHDAGHQQRQTVRLLIQLGQYRPRLLATPQTGQIQMHAHEPQRRAAKLDIGHHRAARHPHVAVRGHERQPLGRIAWIQRHVRPASLVDA